MSSKMRQREGGYAIASSDRLTRSSIPAFYDCSAPLEPLAWEPWRLAFFTVRCVPIVIKFFFGLNEAHFPSHLPLFSLVLLLEISSLCLTLARPQRFFTHDRKE